MLKDILSKFFKSDNEKDYEATELISVCGRIGEINQDIEEIDNKIKFYQLMVLEKTEVLAELNEQRSKWLTKRNSLVKPFAKIANRHKEE